MVIPAVSIKHDGEIFVVILSTDGAPLCEIPQAHWSDFVNKAHDLLGKALVTKDEMLAEGKLTDDFYFPINGENPVFK